jgi:hypothetical protein
MFWIKRVVVLLLFAAVFPGCSVDSCRNELCYTLDGNVRDYDGSPIRGITVYGYADIPEGVLPEPACSTRTDASGDYRLSFGCDVKEFVVIPVSEGCAFSPPNRFWHPEDPLDGYDFTVYCGEGYMVDGHVWGLGGPGEPLPGVIMYVKTAGDITAHYTETDENGYYVFPDLYPVFEYEIAPSGYCPEFEPASRTIKHPTEDFHDQDFTAVTPTFVYIRGCVTDPYGAPLEGVTIECTYRWPGSEHPDSADRVTGLAQISVETGPDGCYQIHTLSCRYIEVRPSEPGCFAVPHLRVYGPSRDIDGQDYTLFCGGGRTISGYLKDEHGEPVPNTGVYISGQEFGWHAVTSDVEGYYEFTGLPWGLDYIIKPGRCPYYCTCEPAQREYENLARDYSDQDFTMSCTR